MKEHRHEQKSGIRAPAHSVGARHEVVVVVGIDKKVQGRCHEHSQSRCSNGRNAHRIGKRVGSSANEEAEQQLLPSWGETRHLQYCIHINQGCCISQEMDMVKHQRLREQQYYGNSNKF